jgi:hypothetical protein
MWTGLGLHLHLCGERPATNHISQGAVPQCLMVVHINIQQFPNIQLFLLLNYFILSDQHSVEWVQYSCGLISNNDRQMDTEHITPTVHIPVMAMILQLSSLPVAYGTTRTIHCYHRTAHMVVSYKTKINVTWDMTLCCWASTSRYFEQL